MAFSLIQRVSWPLRLARRDVRVIIDPVLLVPEQSKIGTSEKDPVATDHSSSIACYLNVAESTRERLVWAIFHSCYEYIVHWAGWAHAHERLFSYNGLALNLYTLQSSLHLGCRKKACSTVMKRQVWKSASSVTNPHHGGTAILWGRLSVVHRINQFQTDWSMWGYTTVIHCEYLIDIDD
jgi:hypothetical protein